jgi:ABC-type Fe3+/spermidine/putrescine transport system ATPase subunit
VQKRLGLTIILVTHDQLDAFTLSDRIGVMRNGQIEQIDEGRLIYERPNNQFVREFVGRSVMLHGILKNRDGVMAVVEFGDGSRVDIAAANCATGLSPGDPVSVWTRPEDLHVASAQGSDGPPGALPGTVTSAVFLGDRYGCAIALDCGQAIWTYVQRAYHPKRDDRVRLALDPQCAHVAGGAGMEETA